jgi:4-hydroxy-tetrahydrodipicolinate synthase
MSGLHGVLTALVTPFTPGGELIDENALRALVEGNIGCGVHGLVPCGSTGEFAAMSNAERRQAVEIVVDQANGRVPVVAHTAAMTTREAIELSSHANEVGAAAVMVVAPYYEPLTIEETKNHYRELAEAVDIDIMLYNLPVATGVNLLPADVRSLAEEIPSLKFVKDTSGDFGQAARLIHDHADVIKTFVGWDTLYFASLVEGAAGSVNGAANFIGRELVDIYEAVKAGQVIEARGNWDRAFPVMQFLCSGGYVSGVKAALEICGRPVGDPRRPLGPLEGSRAAELKEILQLFGPAS